MKYWINEISGNDKLVIWDGEKLHKGNPKDYELRDIEYSFNKEKIPKGLFSIHKSQIRLIEMDESKKYICVYFGADSYEHIRVLNTEKKIEIFNEFTKTENVAISIKELSLSEKTKTQKKALIVLTILFIIGLFFSSMIETEALPNGRYPAILLLLGGLGMINLIIFYVIIILIIGIKYYLVSKSKKIIHSIKFK